MVPIGTRPYLSVEHDKINFGVQNELFALSTLSKGNIKSRDWVWYTVGIDYRGLLLVQRRSLGGIPILFY